MLNYTWKEVNLVLLRHYSSKDKPINAIGVGLRWWAASWVSPEVAMVMKCWRLSFSEPQHVRARGQSQRLINSMVSMLIIFEFARGCG